MQPPNDVRHFVHKRILGAAIGVLSGGGITGAIRGFSSGGSGRSGGAPTALPVAFSPAPVRTRAMTTTCRPGEIFDRKRGLCRLPFTFRTKIESLVPGGATGIVGAPSQAAENVVMGRFGAAYAPMVEDRQVRECLPGDVLGRDGLCYPKSKINKKDRQYPPGTRPLGTPGEMACLRKAAAFGRRMETTVKRMQKIGVLKKPSRGSRKQITSAAQHHAGG